MKRKEERFHFSVDGKVELREDFDKLKIQCDSLKIENDLLENNFQELIDSCKWDKQILRWH